MIDLNSVKARLGSIPVPIYDDRPSLKKLLTEDMPALIVEVSILRERLGPAGCNLLGELLEYRRSKAAREETVKLGEARGRHLP